jgi:hypothetical protein
MVDVYINDRDSHANPRRGEYTPTSDYTTTEIWNRHSAMPGAGPQDHEQPVAGSENHIFVRVRNRGYNRAEDVSVRAYFATQKGNSELKWNGVEQDGGEWSEMLGTPGGTTGLSIERGNEVVAGPFAWTPGVGSVGKKACIVVSASAPGDPSNLDTDSGTLGPPYSVVPAPLWWLVPFDNNIGMRDMMVT